MKPWLGSVLLGVLMTSTAMAQPASWPEGISPTEVYGIVDKLNQSADTLLVGKRIKTWQSLPANLTDQISPMVVFQLTLATIEILHDYELRLGMRPIPIMTSSPIHYYPADVAYVAGLILGRNERIAAKQHVTLPKPRSLAGKTYTSDQVYRHLLDYYVKLLALDGVSAIGPDETYAQMHRANQELKAIVLTYASQLTDPKEIRTLAAATYGTNPYGGQPLGVAVAGVDSADIYKKTLVVRQLLSDVMKKTGLSPLTFSTTLPKDINPINTFIQSQIIIAELGEWKRKLDLGSGSPITDQVNGKTHQDVMQELMSIEYMLLRLQLVQSDD